MDAPTPTGLNIIPAEITAMGDWEWMTSIGEIRPAGIPLLDSCSESAERALSKADFEIASQHVLCFLVQLIRCLFIQSRARELAL